jgi:hypothetical protein
MPHNPHAPAVSASMAQGHSHGIAVFFTRDSQVLAKIVTGDKANSPEVRATPEIQAMYPAEWAAFMAKGGK